MNVAVIGGGPAGVACASLLKRYNVDVTIYEKRSIGGLIENAWCVENFPLVEPSSGVELARKLRRLVEFSGINVIFDEIIRVESSKLIGKKDLYNADIIVLATGTVPKRIPDFEVSNRVVYEYRDLPKDVKNLAIYGGGDVAFDSAINAALSGIKTTVFVRNNSIKAVQKLVEKAYKLEIEIKLNSPIDYVNDTADGIELNVCRENLIFDALLICIGREVNLPIVENTEDFYVIGDAAHIDFRQSSIAIGDGIKCAMEIVKKLKYDKVGNL